MPASDKRKVATFIWTQEFDTLNHYYSNKWFSQITDQLWNVWAWEFDDKNEPFPVLVKELPSPTNGGISADGKVITMKLRDDITWSDGYFFFICGDDTFAFRDNEYLFGRVAMKFVPYTLAEVYLLYQEVFTQVSPNNRLQGDWTGK